MWTIALALFPLITRCSGLFNYTYDDDDPAITYQGRWIDRSSFNAFDLGGKYRASFTGGNSTFTFDGVAVYYLSAKYGYPLSVLISVDSQPATLVDLQDYSMESALGQPVNPLVLWSATGLSNGPHTVVVTPGPNAITIVDGFIVSIPEPSDSSLPATTSTTYFQGADIPTSSSTSSSTHPKKSPKILAIALGVTIPLVCIITAIIGIWFYTRVRKQRNWEDEYRKTILWSTPTRLWFDGQFITPETRASSNRSSTSAQLLSPPIVSSATAERGNGSSDTRQNASVDLLSDASVVGSASSSNSTRRSPEIDRSEPIVSRNPPPRYKSSTGGRSNWRSSISELPFLAGTVNGVADQDQHGSAHNDGRIHNQSSLAPSNPATRWLNPAGPEALPHLYTSNGVSYSERKPALRAESSTPNGPMVVPGSSRVPDPIKAKAKSSSILQLFGRPRLPPGNPHRLSIV